MTITAPVAGYCLLAGAALACAALPIVGQLAFAAVAIGGVGMAHGASDLAIVAPARRPAFLALYAAVSIACLWWWTAHPAAALPLFLLASAIHFGLEDAPREAAAERIARGLSLIATPAVLHRVALHDLLSLAAGDAGSLAGLVDALAIAGALAGGALLLVAIHRRDVRLATGTLALLLLPPLVGFGVGFLVLHALPQTAARRDQLGCTGTIAYLRTTAPVLLLAFVVAGLIAALVWHADPSGVRPLFAAIAALAMPHLLVTPWFERPPTPARPRRVALPA